MCRVFSGLVLLILLIGMLTATVGIQPVWASETIHILADGSITPSTAPIKTVDNITYTLTGNINVGVEVYNGGVDGIDVERGNIVLDGAGYAVQGIGPNMMEVSLISGVSLGAGNVTVKDMTINGFDYGISLANSDIIFGNNITNTETAIIGWGALLNVVRSNTVTGPDDYGVCLHGSSNNVISGNNIIDSTVGGIGLLYSSDHNSIFGNNVTGNSFCFNSSSDNNSIFHNNLFSNENQFAFYNTTNTWNTGYPSGGNYWSLYNGTDTYKGANQNETGNDGIGDTPYDLDANNRDNYPLMSPWTQIIGDLNGDGKVNQEDLALLASAYKSQIGDPNWNPLSDLAAPFGKIGLADLVTMALHYGQHSP